MPTTIEIRVNGAVWISAELKSPLDKKAIEETKKLFNRIISDKNRDKIGSAMIDAGIVKKFE
jgi:hypothetical protein